MITTKWKSVKIQIHPVKRYVRKSAAGDFYEYCITCDKTRYDIEQGYCEGSDLPAEIKAKCDDYKGSFYACEWPSDAK